VQRVSLPRNVKRLGRFFTQEGDIQEKFPEKYGRCLTKSEGRFKGEDADRYKQKI